MTTATKDKPVNARELRFPGIAGIGGLLSALVAGAISVIDQLNNFPNPVRVAVLGLAGAGLVAAAIASAGDALARAYIVANTVDPTADAAVEPQPAVRVETKNLADLVGTSSAKTAPTSSAAAGGAHQSSIVALPVPLNVCLDGHPGYQAIAARQLDGSDAEYLVGAQNQPLAWRPAALITRATISAPSAPPQIVALPNPVAVTWAGRSGLSAILVRLVKGEPDAFLVGATGETYHWRPAREVTV